MRQVCSILQQSIDFAFSGFLSPSKKVFSIQYIFNPLCNLPISVSHSFTYPVFFKSVYMHASCARYIVQTMMHLIQLVYQLPARRPQCDAVHAISEFIIQQWSLNVLVNDLLKYAMLYIRSITCLLLQHLRGPSVVTLRLGWKINGLLSSQRHLLSIRYIYQ